MADAIVRKVEGRRPVVVPGGAEALKGYLDATKGVAAEAALARDAAAAHLADFPNYYHGPPGDPVDAIPSVTVLENVNVPPAPESVRLQSYDGGGYGGGVYLRMTSALPGPGVRFSKDGAGWKLKTDILTPLHFGPKPDGDGTVDNTAAFIEMMQYAGEFPSYACPKLHLPGVGIYKLSQPLGQYLRRGMKFEGDGVDASRVDVALDGNTVLFDNGTFNTAPANPYDEGTAPAVGFRGIFFNHGAQSANAVDGTRNRILFRNNGGPWFELDHIKAYGFKYLYAAPFGGDMSRFAFINSMFNDVGLYFGPGSNQITVDHFHSASCAEPIVIDRAGWGKVTGQCSFVDSSVSDITAEYFTGTHPRGPGTGFTRFGLTSVTPGYAGHSPVWTFDHCQHESNNGLSGRGPAQHILTDSDTPPYPALLHIGESHLVAGGDPNPDARLWRNTNGGGRHRIDTVSYSGTRLTKLFEGVVRSQIGNVYALDGSPLPAVFSGGVPVDQHYTDNISNRGQYGQSATTRLGKIRQVGDAHPRRLTYASGEERWGDGTIDVGDTYLRRRAANSLETGDFRPTSMTISDLGATQDAVVAQFGAGASGAWLVRNFGAPVSRRALVGQNSALADALRLDPNNGIQMLGKVQWGATLSALDTRIERTAAGELTTDALKATDLQCTFFALFDDGTVDNKVIARFGFGASKGYFSIQNAGAGTTRRILYGYDAAGAQTIILDPIVGFNTTLEYRVGGVKVVGARGAALPADATDLASVIALANAIKARLKATGGHGLVAD